MKRTAIKCIEESHLRNFLYFLGSLVQAPHSLPVLDIFICSFSYLHEDIQMLPAVEIIINILAAAGPWE